MTDMTPEQALEWLQTIAAISTAVVSDRPLSFSYQEAVKFQEAVKALTAPRVPDGWVPIDDKLPEIGQLVAIMDTGRYANMPDGLPDMHVTAIGFLNEFNDTDTYWSLFGSSPSYVLHGFTHWLALPNVLTPAPPPVAVPEGFEFVYIHPTTKEKKTVVVTRETVSDRMTDYLDDMLSEQICQCQPVGETNFVECNCEDYIEGFELQSPSAPSPDHIPDASKMVEPFQIRVARWMQECFGPEISADKVERNHRFLEEALELVQALGCTKEEASQLVDYVYGRAVGDPPQEVGGVMVTLAALCLASGMDMDAAAETELARILQPEVVTKIREKQKHKPAFSPLPGSYPEREPVKADECCCGETEDAWRLCPAHGPDHIADVGKVPDGFALVPVDKDGGAKITNEMKGHHIGKYKFQLERPCPKCALRLEDHYDEVECLCGGSEEMAYQESVTIPWDVCKNVYKGMAKTAILSADPPPVAQNVEWFFYDAENGNIEICETKEEALSKAQKAVDFCFDECWSDEVEQICVGTITHRAKQTDLMFKPQKLDEDMFSEDGEHWPEDCESKCDYSIEPIDPQPQGGGE